MDKQGTIEWWRFFCEATYVHAINTSTHKHAIVMVTEILRFLGLLCLTEFCPVNGKFPRGCRTTRHVLRHVSRDLLC